MRSDTYSVNFFKEIEIHKPDIIKIDGVIYESSMNCRDNHFEPFGCSYICDIEFTIIKTKKTSLKKSRYLW